MKKEVRSHNQTILSDGVQVQPIESLLFHATDNRRILYLLCGAWGGLPLIHGSFTF